MIIVLIDFFLFSSFFFISGELGKAPEAVEDSLPVPESEGAVAGPSRTAVALEDDEDMDDMKARLEALRS